MTVTINFRPYESAGYTPRKSLTLHNVESIIDKGVDAVEIHMQFADQRPTFDHVVSVLVKPETDN